MLYKKQLDGLRAIAVFLVMLEHWLPDYSFAGLPLAHIGVQLFFVLSGYLITGILLDNRPSKGGFLKALKIFYIRRALRILPAFYGVLVVALVLGFTLIQESFWWHFLYLSNFFLIVKLGWYGYVSHFWSLSIEEQFYLTWPLLIWLIPTKKLPKLFIAVLILSPLVRLALAFSNQPEITLSVFTLCYFDMLGFGGAIAWAERNRGIRMGLFKGVAWASFALYLAVTYWRNAGSPLVFDVLGNTFVAIAMGCLVYCAAMGFEGWRGRVLNFKPIAYMGRISYGLYLVHYLMPPVYEKIVVRFNLGEPFEHLGLRFLILSAMTLIVCMLSFHFYEMPINRQKNKYPYLS